MGVTRGVDKGRILYASHGYSTHDRRFLIAATEMGWHVDFARFDGRSRILDDRPLPPGATEITWLGSQQQLETSNHGAFTSAFRELASGLAPDAIHAGPIPTVGLIAARASVAPVIVMSWATDLMIDVPASIATKQAAETALSLAAAVLVDCETVGQIARSLGAPGEAIVVIPWGVDLDSNTFSEPSPRNGALRLLSLRSFEAEYDIETLLRGFAVAVERSGRDAFSLTLAGSGSREDALRRLADHLAVDDLITWTGRVPESEVTSLLRDHDVCVSSARCDGSSISLLQAMAAGRPSIVTDIASNREWVEHGANGWLFEPGSAQALAACIGEGAVGQPALARMALLGRRIVEQRADWNTNRWKLDALYRSLL